MQLTVAGRRQELDVIQCDVSLSSPSKVPWKMEGKGITYYVNRIVLNVLKQRELSMTPAASLEGGPIMRDGNFFSHLLPLKPPSSCCTSISYIKQLHLQGSSEIAGPRSNKLCKKTQKEMQKNQRLNHGQHLKAILIKTRQQLGIFLRNLHVVVEGEAAVALA